MATGFSRVEKTLNRVLFLQESSDILDSIHVRIGLKGSYPADAVGHFRAYWLLALRGITHGIFQILAASSDRSHRFANDPTEFARESSGIRYGIASGQWEQRMRLPSSDLEDEEAEDGEGAFGETAAGQEDEKWRLVGHGSSIGRDPAPSIGVSYSHDDGLIRFRPRLQLRDLDECMFMPILNHSLGEKVSSFDVYANGYHLLAIGPADFCIDGSTLSFTLPGEYTPGELADPWVQIRPASGSSTFRLQFSSRTPRRIFGHEEVAGRPALPSDPVDETAQQGVGGPSDT